jgi:hypothetical protein
VAAAAAATGGVLAMFTKLCSDEVWGAATSMCCGFMWFDVFCANRGSTNSKHLQTTGELAQGKRVCLTLAEAR